MKDEFLGPFAFLAKIIGWILVTIIIVYVLRAVGPAQAASFFKGLFRSLGGVLVFFKDLFNLR